MSQQPERLQLDPRDIPEREIYFLMTSVIVPRPIGWISTVGANGVFNVAPHSYFNAVSPDPPMICFSSTGIKDTVRNCRHTWDFVHNVVSEDLVVPMNASATDLPPNESEFTWSGLTPVPSVKVQSPRVAEAKIALECRVMHVMELGKVPSYLVIGEVVMIHIDESIIRDGRIDQSRLRPVGRLAGSGYSRTADGLFSIRRMSWQEVRHKQPPLGEPDPR